MGHYQLIKRKSPIVSASFLHIIGKTLQKTLLFSGTNKWKKLDHFHIEQNLNPNQHRFAFKEVSTESI